MRKKKQWCQIWIDRLVSEIQQERWHWKHLTKKDMGREKKEPAKARHHHLDSGEETDWDTATSFSLLLLDWFPTAHRAAQSSSALSAHLWIFRVSDRWVLGYGG